MDEIKNNIQKSRLRWFGHVMQLKEERISKKMLHTKIEGKQSRGRPRTRWIDQIRKDLEIRGENWKETQENMENRHLWRLAVIDSCLWKLLQE